MTAVLITLMVVWTTCLTFKVFSSEKSELPDGIQKGQNAMVAFVHGDSIQANWQFISDREKAMFIAVRQAQMSMERRSRPLQEEAEELIAYANGPKATSDEVMMAQNRLVEIENMLGQMQSQQQTELMQMESMIQAEIAVQLSSEVEAFALESDLDVVLNWGRSGEGVLYGQPGFDVTGPLVEFMNEHYVPSADSTQTESKP